MRTPRSDRTAGGQDTEQRFSATLRERTRKVHTEAESSGFIQRLLDGQVGLGGYAALAAEHWVIYTALEEEADRLAIDPAAAPFLDRCLDRLPSLAADLRVLVGPDFRSRIEPSRQARAYADRIHRAAAWSGGYLAHHYTRYLGDLSGGLALGTILARTYLLTPGEDGLRFYHFPDIRKPKIYKDGYRRLLDEAPWSPQERQLVVEEARVAFRLNAAVFAGLDERFRAPAQVAGSAPAR